MATPTSGRSGDIEIDVDALENFTEFLVDSGVHGLFPGSSIGEFSSLTGEQSRTLIRTVTRVAEDVTIYAGCGDTNVEGSVDRAEAAADAGADVAVVVSPYYLATNQSGLESFFRVVADRSPLPVVLYNIPALTGNHLSIETVSSLAHHDNVVGLKDTSGDLSYHYDAITETPPSFHVFQGATELALASLDAGASGVIAGPANVFPEALTELYSAHEGEKYKRSVTLMQNVVAPVVSATADVPTAAAVKFLVAQRGLDIGQPLLPLPTLEDAERERLRTCYERVVENIEQSKVT
jgi:4-hydroxy-tetrahydrodipicolinate synthase